MTAATHQEFRAPGAGRASAAVIAVARIDALRDAQHSPGYASCAGCAMRNICMPAGLEPSEIARLKQVVHSRRRIAEGEHLYRAGERTGSLYAVRSGFVKTSILADDGREQVTGFHMLGEIIGIDAIGGGGHDADAVALEDTHVCEISATSIQALSRELPQLQKTLYRLVSQELHQQRAAMLSLGTMRAEERLAAFLLNLGRRYRERGFSASRFNLRMSRADIGSFLGLRLETVSRLLSRLQAERLLRVETRCVEILDPVALKALIGRIVD